MLKRIFSSKDEVKFTSIEQIWLFLLKYVPLPSIRFKLTIGVKILNIVSYIIRLTPSPRL